MAKSKQIKIGNRILSEDQRVVLALAVRSMFIATGQHKPENAQQHRIKQVCCDLVKIMGVRVDNIEQEDPCESTSPDHSQPT